MYYTYCKSALLIPILCSMLEANAEDRERAKWAKHQPIWWQSLYFVSTFLTCMIHIDACNISSKLSCLWVHNIWRVHVYAPKPHLTFSGYDESLMMTSIGFHIFGPQINKVVRGVGQRLSRGACQCVCVCVSVFEHVSKQSHPASDCETLVLIGGQAEPCLQCSARGLAGLRLVFQVFSKQSLPARLWEFHLLLIRSTDKSRNARWGTSIFGPTQKEKKNSFDRQLCVKRDKEISF